MQSASSTVIKYFFFCMSDVISFSFSHQVEAGWEMNISVEFLFTLQKELATFTKRNTNCRNSELSNFKRECFRGPTGIVVVRHFVTKL